MNASSPGSGRELALLNQLHATKQLPTRDRFLAVLLGLLGGGSGTVAVFETSNELGTAALLLGGFAFLLVAVLGHVPRFTVGGTTVDSELYTIGIQQAESRGRLAGTEAALDVVDDLEDPGDAGEALEALKLQIEATGRSGTPPVGSEARSPTTDPRLEPIRGVLDRFAGFNSSVNHDLIAQRMLDLGYEGAPPRGRGGTPSKSAYVRWTLPGQPNPVTLYQNSAGLISDKQSQLEFAQSLSVGHREGTVHPKVRYYYAASSVDDVLRAAERFVDWARGG